MKLRSVIVFTTVVLGLAGCGGDPATQAQIGPDTKVFVGATLDDVPVPPLAEPLGPLRELRDGIRVRSWGVRNRSLEQVMDFYRDLLADQRVVQAVVDAPGAGTVLRGEWRLEDGVLRVTVQEAPTVMSDDAPTVQLALQLTPVAD